MKKLNTLLIASAAIILMSCGQSNNNTQQVVEENPKVTVTTVNAEYVSQITVYPTTIEADIVNNIAPQSSARISKIYVEIGDKVEAGQVLAKMDEANLEKARLQLVNDSIELGRIKQLHDIGATSQSDFEAMSLKYDVSKRTYLNLLENTLLKSPISGIVTARNYDEGDMLNGDLVISLDTVRSNAELFQKDYDEELHRVIIHGILHLCGLNDKGPGERQQMEAAEDRALALR